MQELITFLEDNSRSRWITIGPMEVYVRKSIKNFLEIANVNVLPEHRNSGVFTKFLNTIEKMKPLSGIFIENVMHERFAKFFKKRNYKEYKYGNEHPCFYLEHD